MGFKGGCQHAETLYMTGTRKTFTLEEIHSAYTRFLQDNSRRDFTICLLDTEEMIGDAAIVDIDPINHTASFTGRSILRKAMALKLFGWQAFAFNTLELNRLELEVFSHNPRTFRSFEKLNHWMDFIIYTKMSLYHAIHDRIYKRWISRIDLPNSFFRSF
ncbi:GNAT family N-acetyltransferase [Bacillus zhangzhouensis]|nr:GNAT family N-acetyltransferase [Bacillus zhangzhouensis]